MKMNKIAISVVILSALIAFAAIMYVFRTMNHNDPHQTRVYCFKSSSDEAAALSAVLDAAARQNGLVMKDRSDDVAYELSKLERPAPSKVIHGVLRRDGNLVALYSNLGSNRGVFSISFWSNDHQQLADIIDHAIQRATPPIRTKVVTGGSFNDSFCWE
jgi:hypothetical protein